MQKIKEEQMITANDCTDALFALTDYLKNNSLTVSTAESATAGYLGKMLTDRSGSSAWYWGGMQTYSVEAKNSMLGVSMDTIKKYGTVSLEVASEMAERIRSLSGTDLGLSITGVAGPDSDERGNAVGTVCLGFSSAERTESVRLHFNSGSREELRINFCTASFVLALLFVNGKNLDYAVS